MIENYKNIIGERKVSELKIIAEKLKNKSILNVNSTFKGGGVAEILTKMIPIMESLGINIKWEIIKGNEEFYKVTKKFHNALHGVKEDFSQKDFEIFTETNNSNIEKIDMDKDIVFIHDPQPIGLIKAKKDNKWFWRCHIDLTNSDKRVYDFLKQFIPKYDGCVFSSPYFSKTDIEIPQYLIFPSIDPLGEKNKEIEKEFIEKVFYDFGIDIKRPIITQISRFDRLKDPVGVIKAYNMVKKHIDCQLILAGGGADDDPEGVKVYEEVLEERNNDPDIHILMLPHNDLIINALQRGSTVILQKSLKEGFGLTISEALWKEKPVIASNVGGIKYQITHKYNGLLSNSIEGTAHYIKQIIENPEYGKYLARNGKEHVKENFLITRHIKEYMLMFLTESDKDVIYF
ncbi:MAG: glycosyltransferase [Elusimicrobiota bacterium]|nr:glycosyltransferase [Elusimicrobiales bacterium]HPO94542.1 glycosyltransferase [Elusimicrobiales bacterium]